MCSRTSPWQQIFTLLLNRILTLMIVLMICGRTSPRQQIFSLDPDKVEGLCVVQVSINPPATLSSLKGTTWQRGAWTQGCQTASKHFNERKKNHVLKLRYT